MMFLRKNLIAKRLHTYEDSTSEIICLKVTTSKRKWCVIFSYRPPFNSNNDGFLKDLNKSFNNITRKYANVLVVRDLETDILDKK